MSPVRMADYRLYCLDGAGKINFAEPMSAADDADAIAQAQSVKPDALKCEVWQGSRLVASLAHGDVA